MTTKRKKRARASNKVQTRREQNARKRIVTQLSDNYLRLLYTVSETASLLRVSAKYIYKLIHHDQIDFIKYAGRYLIAPTAIEKFIESRRHLAITEINEAEKTQKGTPSQRDRDSA